MSIGGEAVGRRRERVGYVGDSAIDVVAAEAGIHPDRWRAIEAGEVIPSGSELMRIAEATCHEGNSGDDDNVFKVYARLAALFPLPPE